MATIHLDQFSTKFLTKEPAVNVGQAERLAIYAIEQFFGKKYQHADQVTVDQGFRLRFEDGHSALICASEYHDETCIELYTAFVPYSK